VLHVIFKQTPLGTTDSICPNCKAANDKKMVCPECGFTFCGQCFIEIPEGDGSTLKCPNTVCGAVLKIPVEG